MTLALFIAAFQLAAGTVARPSPADGSAGHTDSAAARALVQRLRTEETGFFMTWREVWEQSFNGVRPNQARLTAAHCHYDGSYQGGAPHLIHLDSSPNLKSWCPIWYPDATPLRGDARRGPDYALPLYAETRMRTQRMEILRHFDSAAVLFPADAWIAGQRVRLYVDQRMYREAIAAARDCRSGTVWCTMLAGYALYQDGQLGAADSAFARGLHAMVFSDRCRSSDISSLLPKPDRTTYSRLGCAEQATINERFWWLANPLMSEPGNERRAEQFSREVLVALHEGLTVDEWNDWRPQYGRSVNAELFLRYGAPAYAVWPDSTQDAEHFTWMGFTDSSVNATAEYSAPRFHTAPPWHAIADPMSATREDWRTLSPTYTAAGEWLTDRWPWPAEFYARDAGPLVELDDQAVALRRDASAWVVVATQLPAALLGANLPPYVGALVLSASPKDTSHSPRRPVDITNTVVLTGSATGPVIVSAEVMPAGTAPGAAGRVRFALTPPAPLAELTAGEVAISDPVLFRPPSTDDSMPLSAVGALPRMFGSTAFHRAPKDALKVGVFWEVYGLPSTDTVDVAIRVTPVTRSSFLRRLAALVGFGGGGGSVTLQWREPGLAHGGLTSYEGRVPVQSGAIRLDLSLLSPGEYLTELSVRRPGQVPITSHRSITID